MYNRIQIREILAWMTLSSAIILFSVTVVFAQTKTINVENENGKVHIKIKKTENGQEIKIDTSFSVTDDMNVDEIIESLEDRDPSNTNIHKKILKHKSVDQSRNKKQITVDLNFPEMSQADKDKLHKNWEESMKDMRKGIEKMRKSLKNMHIKIDSDSDDEGDFHFNFNFNLPDKNSEKSNDCDGYSYTYKYSHDNDSEMDSLKDEDHIVIMGSKDQELEMENKNDIRDLQYYPNPTGGKFKLTFHTDLRDDIKIQIVDENGKEVYSEFISNFEGDYSKEIDLGNKSKGNYILKIVHNGKSLTKKIVLN